MTDTKFGENSGSWTNLNRYTGNAKTYVGGIEYSATTIEAIYHPEGRARLTSSTWEYEYAVKDHLGNPRVYFKYNGSISFLQVESNSLLEIPINSIGKNHYYPFGMPVPFE